MTLLEMSAVVVVWACLVSQVLSAQSTVFVRFLSPPHGYSHNLQIGPAGAISKEDRVEYTGARESLQNRGGGGGRANQFSEGYSYTRPYTPFEVYGPPPQDTMYLQQDSPSPEPYRPTGGYYNPRTSQAEVTYDPHLISGPQAAEYVRFLFGRGELFFHLIPHERLVLMNQQDRAANNLEPHILASIRPGHPFFLH